MPRLIPWSKLRLLSGALLAAASLLACEQGSEGDRCNPGRAANGSDECNSGLSCVTPTSCVISVCCPAAPPYSDPQCACFANPEGCACNVDAAYDAGLPVEDATVSDAASEVSNG